MSSRGSGRGALFGSGASLAQRHVDVEERDIEAELDGLHDRVSRLRRVVGAIDEETRAHGSLVAELEGTMLRAQAALKETLRKMNRTYAAGGGGCARACVRARVRACVRASAAGAQHSAVASPRRSSAHRALACADAQVDVA
jgi:hypothetical protein